HARVRAAADAARRLDRRDRVARRIDVDALRSAVHGDEARRRRLRPLGCARARAPRHPAERALPRLHRHADRRGRAARTAARAADGAVLRRRGGAAHPGRSRDRPRVDRAAEPRRAVPLSGHPGTALMPRRRAGWGDEPPPEPHIWSTLGYRGVEQRDGRAVIEWDAGVEFCFHAPSGPIVHGGMVATLLDTAMGGACWTVCGDDESFLTADLRVEFLRSARPG